MKKITILSFLTFWVIFLTGCGQQQTVQTQPTKTTPAISVPAQKKELKNIPESFLYDKTTLVLQNTEERGNATLKEYLPQSETFEKYNLLFAIRVDVGFSGSPKEYRDSIIQTLKFKDKDRDVAYAEKDGEFVLYFAMKDPNDKFVEHNAFKYIKNDGDDGIKSYQVVRRDYSVDRLTSLGTQDDAQESFVILDNIITAKQNSEK